MPKISDFRIAIKSTIMFTVADYACMHYLYKLMLPYCKEQNDLVLRELKCKKASLHFYKMFFFFWTTYKGFFIFTN